MLTLTWFHAHADYLKRLLPEGETRFISGRIEWFNGMPQIVHPDHVVSAEDFAKLPMVEPVYPLTQPVGQGAGGKRSARRSTGWRNCRNGRMRRFWCGAGFRRCCRR